MSATPRGLVLRLPLRPLSQSHPLPTCSLARAFSSLHSLRASSPPATKPAKATSPLKSPKSSQAGPQAIPLSAATIKNPVLLQLARSRAPTLLYESASHFWMKLSAWSASVACYSGSAINLYLSYVPSEGLSWFISPIYTVTAVALGALGSFFIFGAANVVKSIRAVPAAAAKAALPAAINPRLTPVYLEIAVKPLIPFGRARVLSVPPEQVSLGRTLFVPNPSAQQMRAQEVKAKQAKKAQWEEDKKRLLTLPFRDAWRAVKTAFYGVKRALTGGGFVKMQVGDRKCKLDMTTGWALNEGRTLEALVGVEGPSQAPPPRR